MNAANGSVINGTFRRKAAMKIGHISLRLKIGLEITPE